jgi:hypothetical protein
VQFDHDSDYADDSNSGPSWWDHIFSEIAPFWFFVFMLFGLCYVCGPFFLMFSTLGLMTCRSKSGRRNAAILFAIGLLQCSVIAYVVWGPAISRRFG